VQSLSGEPKTISSYSLNARTSNSKGAARSMSEEPQPNFGEPPIRPDDLMTVLDALVQAGVLLVRQQPGKPTRYVLTKRGHELIANAVPTASAGPRSPAIAPATERVDAHDECPTCRSTDGFDAVARCVRCRAFYPSYL
jgi:hypothetical protein